MSAPGSSEQNADFKGPESGADPEAFRSWAFEKAREEPLKYATWLTLNAATESVASLQRLLEPGDREVEEWASEATQGTRQLAYAMWLALDATINGLCSLQEKLPHAERWGWIRRIAHMKNQHGDRGGEHSVSENSPGPGEPAHE